MNEEEFKAKTKSLALNAIHIVSEFPRGPVGEVISRQLIKAATSVGANYRAACRARSRAEFTAKLGIVVEEADEVMYWLELLEQAKIGPTRKIAALHERANEILSMTISSVRTARGRKQS